MFMCVKNKQNVTAGMGDCPTLNELMNFGERPVNIIEEIGEKYHLFGSKLLEDSDRFGVKMGAIEREHKKPEDINNAVLSRWIDGEGRKTTSWATLATVLQECGLNKLADEIRTVKTEPRSVQTEPRSVKSEPRSVPSEPRSVPSESRSVQSESGIYILELDEL